MASGPRSFCPDGHQLRRLPYRATDDREIEAWQEGWPEVIALGILAESCRLLDQWLAGLHCAEITWYG